MGTGGVRIDRVALAVLVLASVPSVAGASQTRTVSEPYAAAPPSGTCEDPPEERSGLTCFPLDGGEVRVSVELVDDTGFAAGGWLAFEPGGTPIPVCQRVTDLPVPVGAAALAIRIAPTDSVECFGQSLAMTTGTVTATFDLTPSPPDRDLPPAGPVHFDEQMLPGRGGGMPGMAVGPAGAFVNASALAPGPLIWRSTDDESWTSVGGFDTGDRVFDTDLVVAPDSQHVYWAGQSAAGFTTVVARSTDGGTTWSRPTPIRSVTDRHWLAASTCGRVYLFFVDLFDGSALYTFRSDDGGLTFLDVSRVLLAPAGATKVGKPVVAPGACGDDTDTIYVPYVANDGVDKPDELWLATSTDGGATYDASITPPLDTEAAGRILDDDREGWDDDDLQRVFPSIALAPDGSLHIAYARETTNDGTGTTSIELVSRDLDGVWHGPVRVDDGRHETNVMASVVATADRVDVAWYTADAPSYNDESARWTVALARTHDPFAAEPAFVQSRVSDGVVHVGDLCLEHGDVCIQRENGKQYFQYFLGLGVTGDGRTMVAWDDDTTNHFATFVGVED